MSSSIGSLHLPNVSRKKTAKKGNKLSDDELDLLAQQVSLLSPILPPDIIEGVTKTLSDYGSKLFSDLFDSFGAPDTARTKRCLKREDSHVSSDDVVWRKNERRRKHIQAVKELLDVITKETVSPI